MLTLRPMTSAAGIAEQPFSPAVERLDAPFGVDDDDAVDG